MPQKNQMSLFLFFSVSAICSIENPFLPAEIKVLLSSPSMSFLVSSSVSHNNSTALSKIVLVIKPFFPISDCMLGDSLECFPNFFLCPSEFFDCSSIVSINSDL